MSEKASPAAISPVQVDCATCRRVFWVSFGSSFAQPPSEIGDYHRANCVGPVMLHSWLRSAGGMAAVSFPMGRDRDINGAVRA